jgi:signal transduction histidine kinase
VVVDGDTESARVVVTDDGERGPSNPPPGYGLVGMAERVTLLGGTLEAGPRADRGWTVEATIPRQGVGT